jgi:hypothetical protein
VAPPPCSRRTSTGCSGPSRTTCASRAHDVALAAALGPLGEAVVVRTPNRPAGRSRGCATPRPAGPWCPRPRPRSGPGDGRRDGRQPPRGRSGTAGREVLAPPTTPRPHPGGRRAAAGARRHLPRPRLEHGRPAPRSGRRSHLRDPRRGRRRPRTATGPAPRRSARGGDRHGGGRGRAAAAELGWPSSAAVAPSAMASRPSWPPPRTCSRPPPSGSTSRTRASPALPNGWRGSTRSCTPSPTSVASSRPSVASSRRSSSATGSPSPSSTPGAPDATGRGVRRGPRRGRHRARRGGRGGPRPGARRASDARAHTEQVRHLEEQAAALRVRPTRSRPRWPRPPVGESSSPRDRAVRGARRSSPGRPWTRSGAPSLAAAADRIGSRPRCATAAATLATERDAATAIQPSSTS